MKVAFLALLFVGAVAQANDSSPLLEESNVGDESVWGAPIYQSKGWRGMGKAAQYQRGNLALLALWDEQRSPSDAPGSVAFWRLQSTDGKPLPLEKLSFYLNTWSDRQLLNEGKDGIRIWKVGLLRIREYPGSVKIDVMDVDWPSRHTFEKPESLQPVLARAPIQ